MKLAKDDLVAALRLRYDHYSAPAMFEMARERAGLADQPAYDVREVGALRAALEKVGDRLDKVKARLDFLLEGTPTAEPASSAKAEPASTAKAEPAKAAKAEGAKTEGAKTENAKAEGAKTAKTPDGSALLETTIALTGVECGEGEQIMMCGGFAALGDWDPSRACAMSRDGDRWVARLARAADAQIAFKFLRRAADGKIVWEDGDNRELAARPEIDAVWR